MEAGKIPSVEVSGATFGPEPDVLSAVEALFTAWKATIRLLFRPVVQRRWISLSIVCVFLGGGTTTAAFQWGLGALPIEFHAPELFFRLRLLIAQERTLVVLAGGLTFIVILGLVYARCVLRFVLIETVIRQEIAFAASWKTSRACGRSYFLWLVAVVGAIFAAVCGILLISFHHLTPVGSTVPWWVASLPLLAELVAVVFIGLLVGILITLTDDLAAPLMYAKRISLPAAWRILGRMWADDRATLLLYIVLRFAASLVISMAALFVLFPALFGLSSATVIAAGLGSFLLRLLGLGWAWNSATLAVGLGLFTLLLFVLLSVIGMPGQVFLQNYGVRFMASRSKALGDLCRATSPLAPRR